MIFFGAHILPFDENICKHSTLNKCVTFWNFYVSSLTKMTKNKF